MADTKPISPSKSPSLLLLLAVFAVPIGVAMILYGIDEFNASPLPEEGLSPTTMVVPKHYNRVLSVMEKVGDGLLPGPEDLVYDAEAGVIYASCNDGWIYKVRVASSAAEATVEKWVHVGGRPLGLAFGSDNELIVAESDKDIVLDLNGDVIVRYSDPGSALVTAGIKIDNYIYYGALVQNYIARFILSQIASSAVV